jgi:hypothetical protein
MGKNIWIVVVLSILVSVFTSIMFTNYIVKIQNEKISEVRLKLCVVDIDSISANYIAKIQPQIEGKSQKETESMIQVLSANAFNKMASLLKEPEQFGCDTIFEKSTVFGNKKVKDITDQITEKLF